MMFVRRCPWRPFAATGTQTITAPMEFGSRLPNEVLFADVPPDAIGLRACGFYGILTGR